MMPDYLVKDNKPFIFNLTKRGFAPNPTSFFALDAKNEARKIKTKRSLYALPQVRNF